MRHRHHSEGPTNDCKYGSHKIIPAAFCPAYDHLHWRKIVQELSLGYFTAVEIVNVPRMRLLVSCCITPINARVNHFDEMAWSLVESSSDKVLVIERILVMTGSRIS